MPDYVLAFVIAAGVALLVTPGVIFLAKKTGAMDAPDARKVHKRPVPRIGGLGIYLAFLASMLVVLSTIVAASTPSGNRCERRSIAALTLPPTATALLPGCW